MICQTLKEALAAAEQAQSEGLQGLYPSACVVLAQEIKKLYRRVPLDENGNSAEPAQYFGCYVTEWGEILDEPSVAFVSACSLFEIKPEEIQP